jgi:hypothetical protein
VSLSAVGPELAEAIRRLRPQARKAVALACAERVVGAMLGEARLRQLVDADSLKSILGAAWESLSSVESPQGVFSSSGGAVVSCAPPSGLRDEVPGGYTAEDAVLCLAQAIRTCLTGDRKDAIRTAAQAYETLDAYVIDSEGMDVFVAGGEQRVQADARITREVDRLRADIVQLQSDSSAPSIQRIRARAITDALSVFH